MSARGHSGEPFSFDRISPSRVNSYLSCGHAFKRKYIDHDPPERSGSSALFGRVVHHALEKWAVGRQQNLVTLVAQAWIEQTEGTPIRNFLGAYQSVSVECARAEQAARVAWEAKNPGKESKKPRATKEFKESAAAQSLAALLAHWVPILNEQSPWRFTDSDPLPSLYDESLALAKRYASKWGHMPASLHTEFGFDVEWQGFMLTGYIDCIDPVIAKGGVLLGYGVTDYKTYRAEPPGAKDWRQAVIYDIAFRDLCKRGVLPFDSELPVYVVFDYVRLGERRDYVITDSDRAVLLDDLTMYRNGVSNGVYLPAQKNANPDFCDYGDSCCLRTRGEGTGCRGNLYAEAA